MSSRSFILPALLVIGVAACASADKAPAEPADEPRKPAVEVDVAALIETANGNEAKAKSQVEGKRLIVEGAVQHVGIYAIETQTATTSMDENILGGINPYSSTTEIRTEATNFQRVKLTGPESAWTSFCFFLEKEGNGVAELDVGQQVRVRGDFTSFHRGDDGLAVTLMDCELERDELPGG